LSCSPATIRKGTRTFATAALLKPQVGTDGARRTPGPHFAPTGSDSSISSKMSRAAAASYWPGQPTWRSQLAMKSERDCTVTEPSMRGSGFGSSSAEVRP
jgi:hypothetical protein